MGSRIFPVVFAGEMASAPAVVDHLAGVRKTRSNCIAQKSKAGYAGKIAWFLIWLTTNLPDRLVPSFKSSVDEQLVNEVTKKKKVGTRDWIIKYCDDGDHHVSPLADTFTADDLAAYLKVTKGGKLLASNLQGSLCTAL